MAKSKKKSDFQKTKLRVGRKIAKNKNLVDTKFKSKKIVLAAQLKQYVGRPEVKVKYDIEELIKGLDHGVSRKVICLNKIKQLLEPENDVAVLHVPALVRKLCGLTLDKDGNVRKEAFSALSCLFYYVSDEQMKTQYTVLKSFISCATTHLDEIIRCDSLKFLDLVLDCYPQAICNSSGILIHLLNLISHNSDYEGKSVILKRSLTTNIQNMVTAQEWRVQVLKRIAKLLDVNTNLLNEEEEISDPNDFDFEKHSLVIFRHFKLEPKNLYGIKRFDNASDSLNCNQKVILNFLNEVMSLLFEVWSEAAHLISTGKFDDAIELDSAEVIMVVSQSLCSIMEWISALSKQSLSENFAIQFKKEYRLPIQNLLLSKFPYEILEGNRPKEKWRMGKQIKITTSKVNLLVCKVYALFILDSKDCISFYHEEVLNFLSHAISELDSTDFTDISDLLAILKMFFLAKEYYDCESLLAALFTYYQKESHVKELIRSFFSNLVLSSNSLKLAASPTIHEWLKYFLKEFIFLAKTGKVDDTLLRTTKKISCYGFSAFIESLEANAKQIISLLCENDEKIRDISLFLFLKMPVITKDHFFKLAVAIDQSPITLNVMKQLFSQLMFRMNKYDAGFSQEDFVCFLLNIAVGTSTNYTKENVLNQGRVSQMLFQKLLHGLFTHVILPDQDWSREKEILDLVLMMLHRIPNKHMLACCIQTLIEMLLSNTDYITVHRACLVLEFYTQFLTNEMISEEVEDGVANIVLATCMYEMALFNLKIKQQNKIKCSMHGYLLNCRKNFPQIVKVFLKNIHLMKALEPASLPTNIMEKFISCSPVCSETRLLSAFVQKFDSLPIDSPKFETWSHHLLLRISSNQC